MRKRFKITGIIIFIFGFYLNMFSQNPWNSDKQIDSFDSISGYWYIAGVGATQTYSIDYGDYKEGTGSLKLDINFQSGVDNYVQVVNNYGTATRDWSYMPYGLSITVKGGGTSDKLRILLFEDHGMDGNYLDPGDEIWYYDDTSVLSGTSWQTLIIPFSSFSLFSPNNGNLTLDLNRIRAWELRVISDGTSHSETIRFDDLRLLSTYTLPVNDSILTGSFFQLWNTAGCQCGQWTQERWQQEFETMKSVCQDTVIIQYSIWENASSDVAWYPTNLPGIFYKETALDKIMAAAEVEGMKVFIGLYFNEDWNTFTKTDSTYYLNLYNKQQTVIDELWTRYGSNPAFYGWYIPQEIDDLNWQKDPAKSLVINYFKDVSDYCKTKSSTKPVMIASFFGLYQPADVEESWWNDFFTTVTNIDINAPQDGIGVGHSTSFLDVAQYYTAIKNACDANGVTFGADVESFKPSGGPTDIDTFKQQLWTAGSFTNFIVQFEWANMEPSLGGSNLQLFNDYSSYTSSKGCTPSATTTGTPSITYTLTNTQTPTVTDTYAGTPTFTPTFTSTQTGGAEVQNITVVNSSGNSCYIAGQNITVNFEARVSTANKWISFGIIFSDDNILEYNDDAVWTAGGAQDPPDLDGHVSDWIELLSDTNWHSYSYVVKVPSSYTGVKYVFVAVEEGAQYSFMSNPPRMDDYDSTTMASCSGGETDTPTYTATATLTSTFTLTYTLTSTFTETKTFTLTNTATQIQTLTLTETFTYTATLTETNTDTPTDTETATDTATSTWTATNTLTDTPTDTPTYTDTATFTETGTPTETSTGTYYTETPTDTGTYTETWTYTNTFTETFTITLTYTLTPTHTFTLTETDTDTATYPATNTETYTPTNTFTATETETDTYTLTSTGTETPILTYTETLTNTITNTSTYTDTATPSNTYVITETPTEVVEELIFEGEPLIYPNPYGGGEIKIRLNIKGEAQEGEVKIYTSVGTVSYTHLTLPTN